MEKRGGVQLADRTKAPHLRPQSNHPNLIQPSGPLQLSPDMVEQKEIVPALFCLSILQDWEHKQILESAMTQEPPWISIAEIPGTAWTKLDVSQERGFNRCRSGQYLLNLTS